MNDDNTSSISSGRKGCIVPPFRVLCVVWLVLLLFTPLYCWFFETPLSVSPFLMLLVLADFVLAVILFAVGIVRGIEKKSFGHVIFPIAAIAGMVALHPALKFIDRERSSLALDVVKQQLAQQTPDAGAVAEVIVYKAEVHTLYFTVRTENNRTFTAWLREHGRTFTLEELSEVSPP